MRTRLGLYGGPRAPYGSFAGKTQQTGGTPFLSLLGVGFSVMLAVGLAWI